MDASPGGAPWDLRKWGQNRRAGVVSALPSRGRPRSTSHRTRPQWPASGRQGGEQRPTPSDSARIVSLNGATTTTSSRNAGYRSAGAKPDALNG